MKTDDDKRHTENFMRGNSRIRRKDFWSEDIANEWTQDHIKHVETAGWLL